MKKCEKCGWVTGNPADSFCEKCGGRLTEMPEKEAGDSQGKRGCFPLLPAVRRWQFCSLPEP